ncbi:MAG TPA: tetratricopeptide repeat-containing protein [Methylocella sp.]|nr:tetratricopeptide repeat-containing protein [Methylocella sp.]
MINSQLIYKRMGRDAEAAIVFVHGFTGVAETTWDKFPDFLADTPGLADWDIYTLGYDSHLKIDIPGLWAADPDLRKVAYKMKTDAGVGQLGRYRSLCLIAHSMGGLAVQRVLLDDPKLRARVSHVFLFGTPSGGLAKASLMQFLKPQLRDMARDGQFIKTLRGEWDATFSRQNQKQLPFKFFAVGGERDEFVPFESSLGPFPEEAYPESRFVVPGHHLQIVKPASAESPSVQLVIKGLIGDAAPAGPWNAARVAVESREFQRAAEQLEPNQEKLDESGLVQLALALEGVGRPSDAIQVLTEHGRSRTDAMGVLAGRLKRQWLLTRHEEDAEGACRYYEEALHLALAGPKPNYVQAYYHGINLAFFALAYGENLEVASVRANEVREYCRKAEVNELAKDRKWRLATEAEAALILGDTATAYQCYREAADRVRGASPRELESMYQQAAYISRLVEDGAVQHELSEIFRPGEAIS